MGGARPVGLAGAGRLQLVRDLVEAGRAQSDDLVDRLEAMFPDIVRAAFAPGAARGPGQGPVAASATITHAVTPGTTLFSNLGRFHVVWERTALFAVPSEVPLQIVVDGGAYQSMTRVGGTQYLVHLESIEPGRTYGFSILCDGRPVANGDVAGYNGPSYEAQGVARGSMTEKRQVVSHTYPGAITDYWLYVNAGVDGRRGAPVMVWHDGAGYVGAQDLAAHRLQIVSDNLVAQGLIPPMAHVLVSPSTPGQPLPVRYEGQTEQVAMRGLQYDTVSERYGRHLLDEVLPDAGQLCKLRADGYSRGSAGLSSGGTCAFTLSWLYPDEFSRAHCGIGSFTALLWDPDQGLDRGHLLPYFVRREARRNIRVWMSDGANDIEVDRHGRPEIFTAGSWPLANLEMANALKLAGYDFHFRFGTAGHNHAQTALDLPESLAWLWRGYDPDGSGQDFEQDEAEQSEPVYRFGVVNRRAW